MIVTGYNATIYTFDGAQYILYSAYRDLWRENIQLRKSIGDKDLLLVQMGDQLKEAASERWQMRLGSVSLKKCPTPQKKLLAALHEHGSNEPVRVDTLALSSGMSKRSIQYHLDEMESKRYISRRYDRNDLYIRLNPDIERSPITIEKMTPVVRKENWGGLREKKETELTCSNCSSPHVRGHRHDSYICDDCGHVGDDWMDIPNMPTILLPAVAAPPVQVQLPVLTIRPGEKDLTGLARPDDFCRRCGRPRRVCFANQEGTWWYTCSDEQAEQWRKAGPHEYTYRV